MLQRASLVKKRRSRPRKKPQCYAMAIPDQRVEEMAKQRGERIVVPEMLDAKYTQWAQGSAQAHSELPWNPEAVERMKRVPAFIRPMVVKSIEDYSRKKGATEVTSELVDEAKAYWERSGNFHS